MQVTQYQCPLCMSSFLDRIEYIEHCKSHDFCCTKCNRVFPDAGTLASHETVHDTKRQKRSYAEFIREDMFCLPCNKRLKSSSQVDQHYKMHDAVSLVINYIDFYPCHECMIIYVNEEKRDEHMLDVHSINPKEEGVKKAPGKQLLTDKVDESCTDYQFLEDDKENDYKEGEYICGDCALVYPSAKDLKYHSILHQTKFRCPFLGCGCQYDQLSRLSIHITNKHINSATLRCLHCDQPFETYDKLQAHMKSECKEKKYNCHECGEFFD